MVEDQPTFYELLAVQKLHESLRRAFKYCLGVAAQRHPQVHRLLDRYDEVFALAMLALEWSSLDSTDASFCEGLYGFKRVGVRRLRARPVDLAVGGGQHPHPVAEGQAAFSALTSPQRMASLFFLVGLPYLQEKLLKAYLRSQGRRTQEEEEEEALWRRSSPAYNVEELERLSAAHGGSGGHTAAAAGIGDGAVPSAALSRRSDGNGRSGVLGRVERGVAACFPYAHAAYKCLDIAHLLMYTLSSSTAPHFSLANRVAGVSLLRLSEEELTAQQLARRRSKRPAGPALELGDSRDQARNDGAHSTAAARPGLVRRAGEAVGAAASTAASYGRVGLVAAVLLFKCAEWWYTTGEERLASVRQRPVPPPPPPPLPAKDGVPLPADPRLCPLCTRERTNPTMLSTSGYVFCYPCAYKYVSQFQRCPVTHVACSLEQLRKLYVDMS